VRLETIREEEELTESESEDVEQNEVKENTDVSDYSLETIYEDKEDLPPTRRVL
jgi:hypothetical protein